MRPLTLEEVTHARTRAVRFWRRFVARASALFGLALLLIILDFESHSQFAKVFLVILLAPVVFFLPVLGWAYREWRRQFETDLTSAVAEESAGKVYDRFRLRSLLGFRRYVVWAEGDKEGLDLHLEPSEFENIWVGDRILVEYLPRTHFVISARKVAVS